MFQQNTISHRDNLLCTASGEELLMLAIMSNQNMRQEIDRELSRRSFGSQDAQPCRVQRQSARMSLAA